MRTKQYNDKMNKVSEMYNDGLISEIEMLNTVAYLTEERLSTIKKAICADHDAIMNKDRVNI